ncbi:MAG: ExbD/TolR family protein [Panacagrimonas sp.]
MKLPRPASRSVRGDEMLPLINVVFLLMMFFMLVGAVSAPEALDVQPARSSRLSTADNDRRSLLVSADGQLALGGEIFSPAELAEQAASWRAQHPGETLQVKADAAADAQGLVAILGVLRAAGVDRVRLLAADAH